MVHRSIGGNIGGLALAPQSIAAAGTANGATISKPRELGRTLKFRLIAGSLVGVTVLTVKPQGRVSSTASWEDILDENLGTPVQFDAADTIAAAPLSNGLLTGSLPIDRLQYQDYRLVVSVVTGATVLLAAIYEIEDLNERFSNRKDHFFYKVTPYDETAPVSTVNG
jgi:hypothetical protein